MTLRFISPNEQISNFPQIPEKSKGLIEGVLYKITTNTELFTSEDEEEDNINVVENFTGVFVRYDRVIDTERRRGVTRRFYYNVAIFKNVNVKLPENYDEYETSWPSVNLIEKDQILSLDEYTADYVKESIISGNKTCAFILNQDNFFFEDFLTEEQTTAYREVIDKPIQNHSSLRGTGVEHLISEYLGVRTPAQLHDAPQYAKDAIKEARRRKKQTRTQRKLRIPIKPIRQRISRVKPIRRPKTSISRRTVMPEVDGGTRKRRK